MDFIGGYVIIHIVTPQYIDIATPFFAIPHKEIPSLKRQHILMLFLLCIYACVYVHMRTGGEKQAFEKFIIDFIKILQYDKKVCNRVESLGICRGFYHVESERIL